MGYGKRETTMKIVITGVAGFIGSHLANLALENGDDVTGIDCFTDYYPRSVKESNLSQLMVSNRFNFHEESLLNADLREIFKNADVVYHLAAQAGVRASWGKSFSIYSDLNVLGTQVVLEAAKDSGVGRVVYASSSSVYGDVKEFPMKETHTPSPVSPYGVTKLAAEHLAILYTKNYGLSTTSLRYFTVYGPRQRPDMAFHIFGKAMITGQPLPLFGDGLQTRDFTYVSDAALATYRAGFASGVDGMVMNIGGGARVSLNSVIETLASIVGVSLDIRNQGVQRGDVNHTSADISRARQYLDYTPSVTLNMGLKKEIDWLRSIYSSQ